MLWHIPRHFSQRLPKVDAVRTLVARMPVSHSETFAWFMQFLHEMTLHSAENGVTVRFVTNAGNCSK
jgi:hypothetical protein